jgi:hypothetical protein
MGKYFDYNLPEAWGGGFGKIFQGISSGLEGRRKADQERQQMELEKSRSESYKAQTDATTANIKRKQQQDDVNFEQGQGDRREKLTEKLNKLTAEGRFDEAKALAMSSHFENPRTHQMQGVTYEQKPLGPAPQQYAERPEIPAGLGPAPKNPDEAPVLPSQSPADYPTAFPSKNPDDYTKLDDAQYSKMSPDAARAMAISRAQHGSTQPPSPGSAEELLNEATGAHAAGVAERTNEERKTFGRYQDEQARHDVAQRAYEGKTADYNVQRAAEEGMAEEYADRAKNPHFILGMPGGKTTEIDPRQAKNAADADARQQADQLRQLALVPGTSKSDRDEYMRVANQIELRLPAAASGAINNAASANQAQGATDARLNKSLASAEKQGAGHDRAKIIAAGMRGNGGGLYPDADHQRVLEEFRKNIEDVTRKGGTREGIDHMESALGNLREHPEVSTNWTNALDAAIRTNTGRAAIRAQYELYTGKAAGADDTAEQLWARMNGDQLSPTQKANLFGAMIDSYNKETDQYNGAYDTADEYKTDPRVTGSPAVRLGVDRTMHSAFRGGKRKHATDTTVPGMPNVPLPGNRTPPPPTPQEDQAAIQMARDRLAKNPNDAVAKRVLRVHGLDK